MPTNQSKYAVAFSDFAWDEQAPAFPKALMVGQYLKSYATQYLPENIIRLRHKVIKVKQKGNNDGWIVQYVAEPHNVPREDNFDYVIAACGYFGTYIDVGGAQPQKGSKSIHSSQLENFRLRNLIVGSDKGVNRKIVVVGGGMSGTEAASSLALQISSTKHSAGYTNDIDDLKVIHVASRPFWCIPPVVPQNAIIGAEDEARPNPAPHFLPLDVCMYDFARREPGPVTEWSSLVTTDSAKKVNGIYKNMLGSDQSELAHGELTISVDRKPPWVAVTESYAEFVREGSIQVIIGRADMSANEGTTTLQITTSEGKRHLDNVVAVVRATGFPNVGALDFLSEEEEIKRILKYDDTDLFLPVVLDNHMANHPSVPRLGFVGYYSGPYWGVMEMQARFLGKFWSSELDITKPTKGLAKMQELRDADKDTERGQWPMSDYVGTLLEFARELNMEPKAHPSETNIRPVSSALYVSSQNAVSDIQSNQMLASIAKMLQETSDNARFTPRATFRALQGRWKLIRQLESRSLSLPSGILTGSAEFFPRQPGTEGFDTEYLYQESGTFQITKTKTEMQTRRTYVYRFRELPTEILSVWFVKPSDDCTVDYHFHDLSFRQPETFKIAPDGEPLRDKEWASPEKGWRASGSHWCDPDQYDADYYFTFQGINIKEWGVRFVVKGPAKDYVSKTVFTRP